MIFIIKKSSLAVSQGDDIHALLRSVAISHNGASRTLSLPNLESQKAVQLKALRWAQVDAAAVTYLEGMR